jgi:hypothetical protein
MDIFDKALGGDDDGFTQDGDLDLTKIKIGKKTDEPADKHQQTTTDDVDDKDKGGDNSGSDEELDEKGNPAGTEYDKDGNPTNLDEEGKIVAPEEKDEKGNPIGTEYDKKGNPTNLSKDGKIIPADDDGFGVTDDDVKDDKSSKTSKLSYSEIANDLADIIPFDEKDGEITHEVFVNKVKATVESASKKLDKTKYDPAIVRVIEHLENDGNILDFYQNQIIRNIDGFLTKTKEDQLRIVITNELRPSVSKDDLDGAVNLKIEEMTDKEKEAKLGEIKAGLIKAKKTEFEKITEETQKFKENKEKETQAQLKKERDTLVSQVDKMQEFMGLPVNDRTRKFIKNEILNGNFDKVLDEDVANVKINAYFYKKFGEKILANFEAKMTEEAKKSFRKGTERQKEVKHNITKKGSSTSSGKVTATGFKSLKSILPKDEEE